MKWKAAIALPGPNSPVIWDNKLFLSGADEKAREIYCYDVNDGKELWKASVEAIGPPPAVPVKVNEETGHAAPTMVAHGEKFRPSSRTATWCLTTWMARRSGHQCGPAEQPLRPLVVVAGV